MVNVRLPATCATRSSPVRRATNPASRFVVSRSMGNFNKKLSPQSLQRVCDSVQIVADDHQKHFAHPVLIIPVHRKGP
ncbi:Flavoprotein WrbA [Caballeronia sordidicola]|uniref:Flavoprotein WrbA n=1 Tax=Caballeronia sordidicola TaxID=196367 RepID=A0A242ME58_CABSO|nr:Flavoprotein WrbA [Caballeronia sordidicola]OTP72423.1 Flavoprotein WrbA [Caballeronia sordidicola]